MHILSICIDERYSDSQRYSKSSGVVAVRNPGKMKECGVNSKKNNKVMMIREHSDEKLEHSTMDRSIQNEGG